MIRNFLMERKSWILLIIVLEILVLLVSFLDTSIPFTSLLYVVFLSLLIFTAFLIIRYHKETKFYKSLADWENHLDLTGLAEPDTPFEKIITDSVSNQTDRMKKEASQNLLALEQEKDELLAWIHEVKTPLTAMALMIDRLDDEKAKASLTFEWLRIHHLLDQQLHQRRIPFMENDLYIESTDLKPLIFKEIKTLQSWCMQKGIGFEVDLEANEVLTDAKWLAFILRQLLTNAVKYSNEADIVIKSHLKDGQVSLKIRDFGRGISPHDLQRIFDKGFTSTYMHQESAATGMGLFLAKKAAQPLLIQIDVKSILGKGTTFTLTFPKKNDFVHINSV